MLTPEEKARRRLKQKIEKLCRDYPNEVAEALLETSFWPEGIDRRTRYKRFDDDTYQGSLSVLFSDDSDAWVDLYSDKDPEDPFSHRFRTFLGGGQSLCVRNALVLLALAIKKENEVHPQHRPPRTK